MTWALIRKDVRLLRPILIMTAMVALFFYVLVPGGWWVANHFSPDPINSRKATAELFQAGNACVWFFLYLIYAGVGGTAFAGERRERWGDLAAMLPVSQRRIIAVKLLVALIVCLTLAAANGVVLFMVILAAEMSDLFPVALGFITPYGLLLVGIVLILGVTVEWILRRNHWWLRISVGIAVLMLLLVVCLVDMLQLMSIRLFQHPPPPEAVALFLGVTGTYFAFAVAFFGYAWLLSSLHRSPAISTAIAIGLIVAMYATWINYAFGPGFSRSFEPGDPAIRRVLVGLLAASGVASVIAGAMVQRYRGTP